MWPVGYNIFVSLLTLLFQCLGDGTILWFCCFAGVSNNQFFCGFLVLFVSNELFFSTFWFISIYERGNVCILSKGALCGCFLLGGWVPAMLYQDALHRKSEGVQGLRTVTQMVILLVLSVLFLETVKGKLRRPSQMDITAPSCFLYVYTCKLSNGSRSHLFVMSNELFLMQYIVL